MSYRSATVISNISTLTYFGQRSRFLLLTWPYDGESLFCLDILEMKSQINPNRHVGLVKVAVDQCCLLGNAVVSLILSVLKIVSRGTFLQWSRYTSHHVAASTLNFTVFVRIAFCPLSGPDIFHLCLRVMVTDTELTSLFRAGLLHVLVFQTLIVARSTVQD